MPELRQDSITAPQVPEQHTCAGCGLGIFCDRYFLQVAGSFWHVGCLRCYACKASLDQELSCYSKHGAIYCREDYNRLFKCGVCARCGQKISVDELVMRVHTYVYHLHCFACATCSKPLNTGDYFGLQDGMVYCQDDYEMLIQSLAHKVSHLCSPSSVISSSMSSQSFYNGAGAIQKGRPRKKRADDPLDDYDRSEEFSMNSPPRQKRMRTSFKHHQIRTMKAYFALNHNPDAKDLKQLAEKTGLSKRVLQVWFQNARAKYRRSVLRQEHGSSGAGSGEDKVDEDEKRCKRDGRGSPALSDVSSEFMDMHCALVMGDSDSALDENSNSLRSCSRNEPLDIDSLSASMPDT